ncbi:hypothetical protein C8Q79DRAFT_1012162 [Trametes meyenii]|nr:hypothetical protein C8Q79DRAFT_1012162 [Trametes meyenii]
MEHTKRCLRCRHHKPLSEFRPRVNNTKTGKKGDPTDYCTTCIDKKKAAHVAHDDRKRKAWEETNEEDNAADGNKIPVLDFGELSAEDFLEIIGELEVPYNICACISVTVISPKEQAIEQRKRVDRFTQAIGEAQFTHWNHEKWYKCKRTDKEVHSYSCAQSTSREQKAKVPRGDGKSRASCQMERSECGGWLHVTAGAESDVMTVCMKHAEQHKPYKDIGLPGKWKKLIRKYASTLTPGKIWREVVRRVTKGRKATDPGMALPFRQKSIYYYWQVVTRQEWRRSSKTFESACAFIEEKGDEHNIKLLDVQPKPGTEALAFYVTDFVEGWAANAQEIAMDSTWNTNSGNFELFAVVADTNGAGIPLAFLFLQTTKEAASGAKRAVLEWFLGCLKILGVEPEFTLSDKDWSEIKAMAFI